MSDNPFIKRVEKRGKTGHGRLSEKRGASSLGARLTPGSGNMRGAKGDARKGSATLDKHAFLIEMKSTDGVTLRVDLGWLVKIITEAVHTGRIPALSMRFVDPSGKAVQSWVAVPEYIWEELLNG